jgi:hypothetical protein
MQMQQIAAAMLCGVVMEFSLPFAKASVKRAALLRCNMNCVADANGLRRVCFTKP